MLAELAPPLAHYVPSKTDSNSYHTYTGMCERVTSRAPPLDVYALRYYVQYLQNILLFVPYGGMHEESVDTPSPAGYVLRSSESRPCLYINHTGIILVYQGIY